MKVIISTVGTSVLTNNVNKDRYKPIMGKHSDDLPEHQALFDQLFHELVHGSRDGVNPVRFSAETNSLSRMKVETGDVLFFLASETVDGILCGKVLCHLAERVWGVKAELYVIKGLQVDDAELFRKVAIGSLVETVSTLLQKYPPQAYRVILNPTGGFKATVPYMTLLGLIEGIPVQYIFERSNQLIELPSAPLALDIEPLRKLGPAAAMMSNDYISEEELVQVTGKSTYQLREEFSDVLVWEDGLVTLTAIAAILYRRHVARNGNEIRVSKTIRKKFRQNPSLRSKFEAIFERMRDPLYRQHHLHNSVQSDRVDTDCFKQGSVRERVFYFEQDGIVYLCDIYEDYEDYRRDINKGTILKEQFLNDFDEPVSIF